METMAGQLSLIFVLVGLGVWVGWLLRSSFERGSRHRSADLEDIQTLLLLLGMKDGKQLRRLREQLED